jgi:uncharacterized radical SAM superfamily Fe-S cluster-containing enzyme
MTEDAAAAFFGLSQTAIHRYRKQVRIPRPEIIMLIKQKTGGLITEADWFRVLSNNGSIVSDRMAAAAELKKARAKQRAKKVKVKVRRRQRTEGRANG